MWIRLTVWTSLLAIAIGVAACLPRAAPSSPSPSPSPLPLAGRGSGALYPLLEFDEHKPFYLAFVQMRQKGSSETNSVSIDVSGSVRAWRGDLFEKTTMALPPAAMAELAKDFRDSNLVKTAGVFTMRDSTDVFDSGYLLVIMQEDKIKFVALDDHSPPELKRFIDAAQAILVKAGSDGVVWEPVPRFSCLGWTLDEGTMEIIPLLWRARLGS